VVIAENTDEERLDTPTNIQSEYPADDTTPPKDTAPVTQNQETKNMEVHKHPHHVTHKKKWGEYLLEFFMLFLAVFLGFVAENIREHAVEHNRSKEYAKSLVQNLQSDTMAIHVQRNQARLYIAIVDSLLSLGTKRLEGRNAAEFYFYSRFTYWTAPTVWNRATFEQIKNSGNLRYFTNDDLLKKLMNYNVSVDDIQMEAENNTIRGNMLLNQINEIMDPAIHHELSKYMLQTLDTMSGEVREKFFSAQVESLENKREQIKKMLNMIVVQQRNFSFTNVHLLSTKEMATELIGELKKEYHFE